MLDIDALKAILPKNRAKRFFQAAWIVNDLHATAERWTKTFGVGPFFVFDEITLEDLTYRGRPAKMDFSAALAQAGDLQIELIRQGCDNPSAYRDLYPLGKEGFHHMAVFSDDYDAELASYREQGFEVATEGRAGPMRYCYVDTSPLMGFMIEILEKNDPFIQVFGQVAEASKDWDGSKAIRSQRDLGLG
jgi:hypothetical protein